MTIRYFINLAAYAVFLLTANGLWMIEETIIAKKRINKPLAVIWICALIMNLTSQ